MFFHFMSNIGSVLRVPRLSLAPSSEVARPDGFLLSRSGSMHSGMLWCTASQRALDCDGEWLGWAGWVRLGWAGVRMGGQAGRQAAVAKVLGQQIAVHAAAMSGGWGVGGVARTRLLALHHHAVSPPQPRGLGFLSTSRTEKKLKWKAIDMGTDFHQPAFG